MLIEFIKVKKKKLSRLNWPYGKKCQSVVDVDLHQFCLSFCANLKIIVILTCLMVCL